MIEKTHQQDDCYSSAIYSDCRQYRYKLTRTWDDSGKRILFIMLNPSKATELKNDPTVERCERRARALGYGAFRVTNIFAWRSTDPKDMRAAADPTGLDNDEAIRESCNWADDVLCAWGTHGAHLDRGLKIVQLLKGFSINPMHLGLSKEGHPKHPLYIAYAQLPQRWWTGNDAN